MLRHTQNPGFGIAGNLKAPRLHCRNQCVLDHVFGQSKILRPQQARERRHQSAKLASEEVLDETRRGGFGQRSVTRARETGLHGEVPRSTGH